MSDLLGAAAALELAFSSGLRATPQSASWQMHSSPTLRLGQETVMPAMAAWRASRVPRTGEGTPMLAPFWIAEILSYKRERLDRIDHLPAYAATGVQFVWLIDPTTQTLKVLRRVGRAWRLLQAFAEKDLARAEPFGELELDLGQLWSADLLQSNT